MKPKTKSILLFVLLITCQFSFFPALLFSQQDYTENEKSKTAGLRIKNDLKTNSVKCIIILDVELEKYKEYSPEEIDGYFIAPDRHYFSKELPTTKQKRFLLRLNNEPPYFYSYYNGSNTIFFIEENDSSLIRVAQSAKAMKSSLNQHYSANNLDRKELSVIRPNETSLIRFFNSTEGKSKAPIDYTRFCIGSTINMMELILNDWRSTEPFETSMQGLGISMYMFHPLIDNYLYIQPELGINFLYFTELNTIDGIEQVKSFKTISTDIFFQGSYSFKDFNPFIGIAPGFQYTPQLNLNEDEIKLLFGFSMQTGLRYHIYNRINVFCYYERQYYTLFGKMNTDISFKGPSIHFGVGL